MTQTKLLDRDELAAVRQPISHASWLPGRLYGEADVYQNEKERIFKREWLPITVAKKLAKPGDFHAFRMAGEPLVLVRDSRGELRCMYNVCRHRGMNLVEGNGNAKLLVCRNHRWAYDLSGRLAHAPGMDGSETFKSESPICLRPVRTEIWNGIVFINMDPDAKPLAPELAGLNELMAAWKLSDLEILSEQSFEFEGVDWKIILENGVEGYHVASVHPGAEPIIPADLSFGTGEQGAKWAQLHHPFSDTYRSTIAKARELRDADLVDQRVGYKSVLPVIEGLPDVGYERLIFNFIWPGGSITLSPDRVTIYFGRHNNHRGREFLVFTLVPASTLESAELHHFRSTTTDGVMLVGKEDMEICRGVQEGMRSGGWRPFAYANPMEHCIWSFHNWYADRMAADGAPRGAR